MTLNSNKKTGLWVGLGVLLTWLSGCTTYTPHPLDVVPPDVTRIEDLRMAAAFDSPQGLSAIKLSDGLDLTEIGILAVLNNPDLQALRVKSQVAGAQVFSAGLLPDPQIGYSVDRPTGNTSGLVNAWALGVNYDIIPLITRGARMDAANKQRDQVLLELLWQEWQVIQQARILAVRHQLETERLALLQKMLARYTSRYNRSSSALQQGDTTLDVNGTDLTAVLDTSSLINQLEQAHSQTRRDLNLLLGLSPGVDLFVTPIQYPTLVAREQAEAQLQSLPDRRPDLLALKAGYSSQEANVRAAILGQFPSLGIGLNWTRDTGNLKTEGISINLNLPLLTGNRGNIAIERATRELLHEEFRSRLLQTQSDIDYLLDLQEILQRQKSELERYLPQLKSLVDAAERAYREGNIDALSYLNMESTWMNKRLEQINLMQLSWENEIALSALLALPAFPSRPTFHTADEGKLAP